MNVQEPPSHAVLASIRIAHLAAGSGRSVFRQAYSLPVAINDAGQITGAYVDINGAHHGFFLTPTPCRRMARSSTASAPQDSTSQDLALLW